MDRRPLVGHYYVNWKNGKQYRVLGFGKHTETLEVCVIYQADDELEPWLRPLAHWNSPNTDGGERFTLR
ncbi:MAG: DUF1653 domain-containing protein [Rhodanobacter sp.]